jgi:CysZ protein
MYQGGPYVLKGLKLIFSKGYRRYAIIPLMINISVFFGLYWLGLHWFWQIFHDTTIALPSWLSWLAPVLNFFGPFVFWIAFICVGIAMLLTLGSISSVIASILASPFNSYLVEKIVFQENKAKQSTFMTVMQEAIIRELQKMIYYIPRLILVFFIFALFYFIPVVNLVGSALFFIFSSWLLSFEYLDYSAESNNIKFKDYKKWLKSHRKLTYSFGITSMGLASIPLLNFLSMPASVAGGALLWLDHASSAKQLNAT